MITIFTDGAARGNPGPGGWGAIVASDDTVMEIGGREDHTTNNRMEMMAAISGIKTADKTFGIHEPVTVYTDSSYVLSGITRWVVGWQRNKWKTSKKEDVLNRDLWEELYALTTHRSIEWKLLKGHSGVPANERCDVIATSYADTRPAVLYKGSRERYGVSLIVSATVPGSMSETGGKKTSKSSSKKSPAYSYVSMVGGVIQTHKTWDECKARVIGTSGAKFKKSVSQDDEQDIISQFKNS